MNKKPGLLFAVVFFAIIILAASFNMNLGGGAIVKLKPGINPDTILYVCQITESNWNVFANVFSMWEKYVYMFFIFATIVLSFSWGWALYQNLLKDKFSADAYKNPWALTKMFFWAGVICTILAVTPNHYRTVHVRGDNRNWVLCENFSEGAHAVRAQAVELRQK